MGFQTENSQAECPQYHVSQFIQYTDITKRSSSCQDNDLVHMINMLAKINITMQGNFILFLK